MANWDRNAAWQGAERRGGETITFYYFNCRQLQNMSASFIRLPRLSLILPSLPSAHALRCLSLSLLLTLSLCLLSACGFEIGYNNAVINGCQSERVNKCQAREDADKTPIDSDNNSNNYNNNNSTSRENSNNNNCYETEVRLDSIYGFNTLKLPVPCQEEIQHLPRNRFSQKFSRLLGLSNVRQ